MISIGRLEEFKISIQVISGRSHVVGEIRFPEHDNDLYWDLYDYWKRQEPIDIKFDIGKLNMICLDCVIGDTTDDGFVFMSRGIEVELHG